MNHIKKTDRIKNPTYILISQLCILLEFADMSNDALWMSDAMLDSLSLQLRDAESRRAEAERAHQVSFFPVTTLAKAFQTFFLCSFNQKNTFCSPEKYQKK